MNARAVKRGFLRGFSAPFLFFSPIEVRRPAGFDGSVEKAWADVGQALSDATNHQGEAIEQKNRKQFTGKKHREKAA